MQADKLDLRVQLKDKKRALERAQADKDEQEREYLEMLKSHNVRINELRTDIELLEKRIAISRRSEDSYSSDQEAASGKGVGQMRSDTPDFVPQNPGTQPSRFEGRMRSDDISSNTPHRNPAVQHNQEADQHATNSLEKRTPIADRLTSPDGAKPLQPKTKPKRIMGVYKPPPQRGQEPQTAQTEGRQRSASAQQPLKTPPPGYSHPEFKRTARTNDADVPIYPEPSRTTTPGSQSERREGPAGGGQDPSTAASGSWNHLVVNELHASPVKTANPQTQPATPEEQHASNEASARDTNGGNAEALPQREQLGWTGLRMDEEPVSRKRAVDASRSEINAQMDRLIPHDGSEIRQKAVGNEDLASATSGSLRATGKASREWDLNKSADPQQDESFGVWGMRRSQMSTWADDEPVTPANGNAQLDDSFHEAAFPAADGDAARGQWPLTQEDQFAQDFPGIRAGRPAPQNPNLESQANFPSLGGGPVQPSAQGAWGSNNRLKDRLTDGQPFTRPKIATRLGSVAVQSQVPVSENVEDWERKSELRHPADTRADAERRRQMLSEENFQLMERLRGGYEVNSMAGLELHRNVLSLEEQVHMEQIITHWVKLGLNGNLRGRTFSAPRKWAPGKGRMTVQFGCCYNYAKDSQGRDPGIIAEEIVEPMPPVLVALARRLVRWNVLPKEKEPDSAIVNIYEEGDCIPPHIDHHDFVRPFCTISLLSEERIMFGSSLRPEKKGEFTGVFTGDYGVHDFIKLPVGSCLVLKGNGADVAKHCVPPVTARRMSITLRKMGKTHAENVRAEVAKAAAGAYSIRNTSPDAMRVEGSDGNQLPERQAVDLRDLIVDKRSRNAAAKDSRPVGRWDEVDDRSTINADRW